MMQASPANSFPFSPLEFAILFIALWCLISFMVSLASGWFTLSRRFKKESEPYGQTKSAGPFFYSIYMRVRCHYGSVIRLTAAEDALYFSVLPILRIAHPPLRIPWTEIRMSRAKYLWVWPVVFFRLGNEEQIPMRIPERMARKLGILDRVPEAGGISALSTAP
jgi:hypothetical protein